jgi:hypothetical protein
MSFAAAEQDLRKFFSDRWTATFPNTPIFAENQKVTPPSPVDITSRVDLEKNCYVKLNLLWGESQQADINGENPRFRTVGVIVVQLFAPSGYGTGAPMDFADAVASMFRRLRLGGMLFRSPHVTKVGDTGDGWYQINVTAPMHFDAIYS